MAFKGTSALVVACVLFRAATCARRSRDPQLEQQFSNWFQDDGWHEHYEVARGRGAMWRQWTTEMDPLAVCNDGSPGAFYVRRGQGQGLNRYELFIASLPHCEPFRQPQDKCGTKCPASQAIIDADGPF